MKPVHHPQAFAELLLKAQGQSILFQELPGQGVKPYPAVDSAGIDPAVLLLHVKYHRGTARRVSRRGNGAYGNISLYNRFVIQVNLIWFNISAGISVAANQILTLMYHK